MAQFAREAAGRGIQVIIAGAGGAAHLPGMVAAHTALPVLGVPVESRVLRGVDSLLSIVQMPAGIPVAHARHRRRAGAKNAALLAVEHPRAARRASCARRSSDFRAADRRSARATWNEPADGRQRRSLATEHSLHWLLLRRFPRQHRRRHGRRPARAHVCHRRAAHGLPRAHLFARRRHADRPARRSRSRRALRRRGGGARLRARRRCADLRVRKHPDADASSGPRSFATCAPPDASCTSASIGCARRNSSPARACRCRALRAVDQRGGTRGCGRSDIGTARGAEDRGLRLRRQGPAQARAAATISAQRGQPFGGRRAVLEAVRRI